MTKLSKTDIEIILDLYKKGESFTDISKRFNVSRNTITRKIKKAGIYQLKKENDCELCGKTFYPTSYGSQIQKYCSDSCRNKAHQIKNKVIKYSNCRCCDKKFEVITKRTFCSNECADRYKELEKRKRMRLKKCRYCDRWHYKQNTLYCSEKCQSKRNRLMNELSKSTRLKRARSNGQFDADIDIYRLIERDGEQCYLCGDIVLFDVHYNNPKYPTIEHVMPISKGGTHSWDNVKVACRDCNTRKSTKSVEDFMKGGG